MKDRLALTAALGLVALALDPGRPVPPHGSGGGQFPGRRLATGSALPPLPKSTPRAAK